MADSKVFIPVNRDLLEQSNVCDLAELLGVSRCDAAMRVVMLTAYALERLRGEDAESGSVWDLSMHAVEKVCYWEGEAGELYRAFEGSGVFVGKRGEYRIASELWTMCAGKLLKGREAERKKKNNQRKRKQVPGDDAEFSIDE